MAKTDWEARVNKFFVRDSVEFCQIMSILREFAEEAAALHENVYPNCDHEEHGRDAGAMSAIIQYRDMIRSMVPPKKED